MEVKIMTTLNISLPEEMRKFIDGQVAQGGYSTASEYIRELVRQEQKKAAREQLEKTLLEGLNSGPGVEATPEWWERKRADLIRRFRNQVQARKKTR
jgi:antitoxin ParD1/3/4